MLGAGARSCARGGNFGGERFDCVDWRALVADLVIELHWTRDQVLDQIDIPFLEDLHRAWADFPPLRRMVAAASRPQAAGAGVERTITRCSPCSRAARSGEREVSPMADDNAVEIRFSASTDDALDGHCASPRRARAD